MARKRMIDPSIWADSRFGKMSSEAQVMFIGMFCNADDEGRLPGDSLYLSSVICPYKGLTVKQAQTIRDEVLSKMRSVILYMVDDQEYIQFSKWNLYQKVDRPSPSKYPPFDESSVTNRVSLVPNRIEENRKEKKGIEDSHDELDDTFCEETASELKIPSSLVRKTCSSYQDYVKSTGKQYKSKRATVRGWLRRDIQNKKILPFQADIAKPTVDFVPVSAERVAELRQKAKSIL